MVVTDIARRFGTFCGQQRDVVNGARDGVHNGGTPQHAAGMTLYKITPIIFLTDFLPSHPHHSMYLPSS